MPDTQSSEMLPVEQEDAELGKKLWSTRPRDVPDGMSRSQYYGLEIARHRINSTADLQRQLDEARAALRHIKTLQRSIMIDVGSCHSMRGPAASAEMRSDDRDMRRDIEDAFTKIDAALANIKPG